MDAHMLEPSYTRNFYYFYHKNIIMTACVSRKLRTLIQFLSSGEDHKVKKKQRKIMCIQKNISKENNCYHHLCN